MKKNVKQLKMALDNFIKMKCIKVDVSFDSLLYLYFGNLVELFLHPKDMKIHLSTDFLIYFNWHWSILKDKKVIASSRIENNACYVYTKNKLNNLENNYIKKIDYNEGTNEIQIEFENNIILRTYNDIPNIKLKKDYLEQEVFSIYTPNDIYSAETSGKIRHSVVINKYVDIEDYKANPEKYHF